MAKKEINVFNVSFLDLLSGALGAVLILFVIIPKLDGEIRQKLQELDAIEALKVDAEAIESMIVQLQSSVSSDTYNNLQSKFQSLEQTIAELEGQVKVLQTQLAKSEEERLQKIEQIREMKAEIQNLQDKLANIDSVNQKLSEENQDMKADLKKCEEDKQRLSDQIANLEAKLAQVEDQSQKLTTEVEDRKVDLKNCEEEHRKVEESVEALRAEIADLKQENQDMKAQNQSLKNDLNEAKETEVKLSQQIAKYEERLGFQFDDKNVVFVVDISGSMNDDQKLDEIKAGIKMLVATMNEDYAIDIVVFPKDTKEDYDFLFGKLKNVNEGVKYKVYTYLAGLKAIACTPTRAAMEYVFESPNYKSAGTIAFLSDGTPTRRTSGSDCPDDPIDDVLKRIKQMNNGKKVINTIGVGREFRERGNSDKKVTFMKALAAQNNGFYIGF